MMQIRESASAADDDEITRHATTVTRRVVVVVGGKRFWRSRVSAAHRSAKNLSPTQHRSESTKTQHHHTLKHSPAQRRRWKFYTPNMWWWCTFSCISTALTTHFGVLLAAGTRGRGTHSQTTLPATKATSASTSPVSSLQFSWN